MANKSTRKQIIALEVGERVCFDIDKVNFRTVYTYGSELGLQYGRKYMTKIDRTSRTVTISRVA